MSSRIYVLSIRLCTILILSFMLMACTDREPDLSPPLVQTGAVTNISEQGVKFNGLITHMGEGNSVVGFVWGNEPEPILNNDSYVIIDQFSEGVLSVDVTFDLLTDRKYFVRAFGQHDSQIIYGDVLEFQSEGSLPPFLESVNPTAATRGSIISLTGKNFSWQSKLMTVTLDGLPVEIISSTDREIKIKVPENFPRSGSLAVSVNVADRDSNNNVTLRLSGPMIESFSPAEAITGDTVIITGLDFDPVLAGNQVKFGDYLATVLQASATELIVRIPYNVPAGPIVMNVTTAEASTLSSNILILSAWSKIPVNPATFNTGRDGAVCFTIDGVVYYGMGGYEYPLAPYVNLWMFQPESQSWVQRAAYPHEASSDGFGFVIGDKAYYGFGWNEVNIAYTDFKQVYEYNAAANSWTRKSDFPALGRFLPMGFSVGNYGYAGLGTGVMNFRDIWRYNPVNDSWLQMNDFPGSPGHVYGSTTFNGKGYIVRGRELWSYTPETDSWFKVSTLPGDLANSTITVLNGTLCVFGGSVAGPTVLRAFWQYYPVEDIWIRRGDIPVDEGLLDAEAFVSQGKIYVVGGLRKLSAGNGATLNYEIFVFDPHE